MSPANALSHLSEQQKRSKTVAPAAEEERDPAKQAPDAAASWLQQTVGNQALSSLGNPTGSSHVQARSVLQRLVAGPPSTRVPDASESLQRAPEEEDELQLKPVTSVLQLQGEEEELQTKPLAGSALAIGTPASPRIAGISSSSAVLQRAFVVTDPKTYDDDGGHGYGDHGPQTTERQHWTRLTTGVTPSGRTADIPPSSSKFATLEIMQTAMASAVSDAAKDSVSKGKKRSKARLTLAYSVSGAGLSYVLDPKDAQKTVSSNVTWVVIILQQTGAGKWDKQYDKIVTMFPSETAPKQKDN